MKTGLRHRISSILQVIGIALICWGCVSLLGWAWAGSWAFWLVTAGIGMALAGLFFQAELALFKADPDASPRWPVFRWSEHRWTLFVFGTGLSLFVMHTGIWHVSGPAGPLNFVPILKAIRSLPFYVLPFLAGLLIGITPGGFACFKAALLTGLMACAGAIIHWMTDRWVIPNADFRGLDGAITVACLNMLLMLPLVLFSCGVGRMLRWRRRRRQAADLAQTT